MRNKYKKNPCIIAADLQIPAAIDQLISLGKTNNIPVFYDRGGSSLDSVIYGLKEHKKLKNDVAIIDTAGRLHIDEELMSELKDIVGFSKPNNIFYVADSMPGQDAVNSSSSFKTK